MAGIEAEDLARTFPGDPVRPHDCGCGRTTRLWDRGISKHPRMGARYADTGDVAATVNCAHDHGLPLAIRGGGHGVVEIALCDDSLVTDLSAFTGVQVDVKNRMARAQGGATICGAFTLHASG